MTVFSWFHRTAGSIQIQGEEEISTELIEERERAIRQLEVSAVFYCNKSQKYSLYSLVFLVFQERTVLSVLVLLTGNHLADMTLGNFTCYLHLLCHLTQKASWFM